MEKTNNELKENQSIKENKDIKESKEQNLIKKTAKELGMTYKELGEAIGYSESAISNSARQDKVSDPLERAIALYTENIYLKKELKKFMLLKSIIKED